MMEKIELPSRVPEAFAAVVSCLENLMLRVDALEKEIAAIKPVAPVSKKPPIAFQGKKVDLSPKGEGFEK